MTSRGIDGLVTHVSTALHFVYAGSNNIRFVDYFTNSTASGGRILVGRGSEGQCAVLVVVLLSVLMTTSCVQHIILGVRVTLESLLKVSCKKLIEMLIACCLPRTRMTRAFGA